MECAAIESALKREFGHSSQCILLEPGRYMVGGAAELRTEILLISRKSSHEREPWGLPRCGAVQRIR